MAYTYEWKLTGLKKQNSSDLENVIIGTQWKVIATDEDGNKGEFVGATPFPLNSVDPQSFTPYDELTETQVLNWVKNYVSGSNRATNYWDHISERIEKQIVEARNPITNLLETQFPWASGSAEDTPRVPI